MTYISFLGHSTVNVSVSLSTFVLMRCPLISASLTIRNADLRFVALKNVSASATLYPFSPFCSARVPAFAIMDIVAIPFVIV